MYSKVKGYVSSLILAFSWISERVEGSTNSTDASQFSNDSQEVSLDEQPKLPILKKIDDLSTKIQTLRKEHTNLSNEVKDVTRNPFPGSDVLDTLQHLSEEHELLKKKYTEEALSGSHELEIKQTSEGTHEIPGLVESPVYGTDEVWELLKTGSRVRSVGSTNANEFSSRSHCLLRVTVKGENIVNGNQGSTRSYPMEIKLVLLCNHIMLCLRELGIGIVPYSPRIFRR